MKAVEKAAFAATYKTVWVAGPSIEFVHKIETIQSIVERIMSEYKKAFNDLCKINQKS
jgi:nitronate monooxygenase